MTTQAHAQKSMTTIRKVYTDRVFALRKSEVLNELNGLFDKSDSVDFNSLIGTLDRIETEIGNELTALSTKNIKQKSNVKREPTNYNVFVKSMIKQLKAEYPDADKNILMKDCGTIWSHLKNDKSFDKDSREQIEKVQLKDLTELPSLQSSKNVSKDFVPAPPPSTPVAKKVKSTKK